MEKPKIALYWCASCGGCEEATVDLAEKLLELAEMVEIVFWPVAMDFKISDLEKLPDNSITASIINGGIRVSEHERVVKLLRKKSKFVLAYGACACWGGIPGLANLSSREEIMERIYLDNPTTVNPEKILPEEKVEADGVELELPEFLPYLKPLDKVVEVDYYIPGCPPTPEVTWNALTSLLSGKLPPKHSVIGASNKSLCNECPLNDTKPEKIKIEEFKRPQEIIVDPEKCLLLQGLPCLGPVTRGGCGALCIKAGMPCTGCFGPLDRVRDFGGKALSFLASILAADTEEEAERKLSKLVDPVGLVYKYYLPASMLGKRAERKEVSRQ